MKERLETPLTRGAVRNQVGLAAVVLLCLISGSRWLLEGVVPGLVSRASTQAMGALMAALLVSGLRSFLARRADKDGVVWRRAAAGSLALCGPALASLIPRRPPNANQATLALVLCPVVVAVASAASGQLRADLPARLWPGLAGAAGLLLLLPAPGWSDGRFILAMVAMPLLVGVGAALYDTESSAADQSKSRKRFRFSRSVLTLLLTAVVYGALSLRGENSVEYPKHFSTMLGAAGLDGASLLLSLLSLSCLGAERWTAQFLLTPLTALTEGVVLLHPLLDSRSWTAFTLLGVSGAYLLFVRSERSQEIVSLSS